jgi:nucleoside-diphosphate-sugar epimerase
MSRVVVIGATGHIGSYLVPRLVRGGHEVHCGTIWVHGPALRVPVTEDEPRTAYGEYGTGKAEIEALLRRETLTGGVPAVVLHPGHISGPGWPVITPAGNLDPAAWTSLATGQPLTRPASTPCAASPRALRGAGKCWAMRRGSAHLTPCTRR